VFSGDGPGFQYSSYDRSRSGPFINSIKFQLGFVRFYFDNGKVMEFLPVGPADLKQGLQQAFSNGWSVATPATVSEMHGLTTASLTAKRPPGDAPDLVQERWIQVESNIVLKVTAASYSLDAFTELTNSLGTLSVDRARIDDLFRFGRVQAELVRLERVEFGYVPGHGKKSAAFVLRCQMGKLLSFSAADAPDDDMAVKRSLRSLAELERLSSQSNVFRMVVLDMGRYEDAPDDTRRTCAFDVEQRMPTLASLERPDFRISPSLAIGQYWAGKEPPGFEKVSEYRTKALLYIRRKGL
jgi:hypothetical protein